MNPTTQPAPATGETGEQKHSPLPWHGALLDGTMIIAADKARVADCCIAIGMSREEADANAKLIITAVNSHPALLSEREALRKFVYQNAVDAHAAFHVGGIASGPTFEDCKEGPCVRARVVLGDKQ